MIWVVERRLTLDQRGRVAEKIMELGNLIFLALVIAQIVPGTGPFRFSMALTGIITLAVAYFAAYLVMRGGGK